MLQLCSFMGLTGFSHEFIENYAELASPLYHLLKKGEKWKWGPEQQTAFQSLQHALTKALALAYPRPELPFELWVAATDHSLGAVLLEDHGTKPRPVAYASRVLQAPEKNIQSL